MRRKIDMFAYHGYEIAAVAQAAPAWAGFVASRGWASEKGARNWQRQVMGEFAAVCRQVPEGRRDKSAVRVLAFAEGEGRERGAWLRS